METLLNILIATFLISAGALVGIFTLALQADKLNKILLLLVSLSAGALMGGAFIHLLPEASESLESSNVYGTVLLSFIIFFFVEKLFHWRHCHKGQCKVHTFGYMNLCGDAVHNFIDGLILAATFIADARLGVITTLAIALHEIPQEIGDFGVLLYAGFKKEKALAANFLVALTVVLGGVVGYFLSSLDRFVVYLLPFAAGGFIYIAASDLMPEIRKEQSLKKSLASFGVFLIGVLIMYLVTFLEHE
jgi:zinc and cadmium transporter